jgi:hypothetical protein
VAGVLCVASLNCKSMANWHGSQFFARFVSVALLMLWSFGVAAQTAPMPVVPASVPIRGTTMLIVSCDPGGCWDEFGVRYDRVGGGVFIRVDGHECTAVRGRMACK